MSRPNLSLGRMLTALGVITVVAAALMSAVHVLTRGPIEESQTRAQADAIRAVAGSGAQVPPNPFATALTVSLNGEELPLTIYPLGADGHAAVESYSLNGFDGEVRIMYGFDPDGTVTGYQVLKQTETPGLGSKMESWFRDPAGRRSIIGRNPGSENLTVSKDGGDVDAITAATISSRAFLDALNRAHRAFTQYRQQR